MSSPTLPPSTIRNVAMVGHRGCGKTSLAEAMLHTAAAVPRLGSVLHGTTVCDADDDEHRRQMSISAALCHLTWSGTHINLVDTPGEPSFQADAIGALLAADAALLVVGAASGVEVHTERMWRRAGQMGLPRMVVVNMMDRERADLGRVLSQLAALGTEPVMVHLPRRAGADFAGVVDLLGQEGVPADDDGAAAPAHEALVEAVAATDDDLLERYLGAEPIDRAALVGALRRAMAAGTLVPVCCASAHPVPIGVDRLLDAAVALLPSPEQVAPREGVRIGSGEALTLAPRADDPAVALCVKTLADPFSGRVSVLRVLDGVLAGDSQVICARTGRRERVGRLFRLQGKEHVPCDALGPGDIGAVAKLKGVATGDALCADEPLVEFPQPEMPEPAMAFRASAHDRADDDKVVPLLRRMADEDPSLDVHHDDDTGDLIVAGLSELHVEVVAERIAERFGVRVDLAPPHVAYRETITAPARAEGKHKKQSGGRGQFGDCWVRVEPLPRGAGIEFVDEVVGGAIPRQFIGAVESGARAALQRGVIAGYPVVDVRVTVDDGKHHSVDSSEMAFSIAGGLAVREAIAHARPVLLEPVMHVEVIVDPEHVGDVMGDLSARRGHPLGIDARAGREVISAQVPMAEMLTYGADLRAITGGRGEHHMRMDHYAPAPAAVAERVAQEAEAA